MRGMGRVYKHGKIYWVEYWHHGKQYRESSHSRFKTDATELLKTRLAEIRSGTFDAPQKRYRKFHELVVAYVDDHRLQRDGYMSPANRTILRTLLDAFGHSPVAHVDEASIEQFKEQRLQEGRKPGSVNRELSMLSAVFHVAQRKKLLSAIPTIRRLPENNAREGFFEYDELQRLLPYLPSYLRDAVLFAYYLGWRLGEVKTLTWDHVDYQAKVIRLSPKRTKTQRGRVLALPEELAGVLERRWQQRGDVSWVFHQNGQPIGYYYHAWRKACLQAGLENKVFHDLRRTAVRNMIRAGVHDNTALLISGHQTRKMLDRYNIVDEDDLRDAMVKTTEYVKGLPTQYPHNSPEL